jgi:hypothetical protein
MDIRYYLYYPSRRQSSPAFTALVEALGIGAKPKEKTAMRPHIICHMGTSIDGCLHPSRFTTTAPGNSGEVARALRACS